MTIPEQGFHVEIAPNCDRCYRRAVRELKRVAPTNQKERVNLVWANLQFNVETCQRNAYCVPGRRKKVQK